MMGTNMKNVSLNRISVKKMSTRHKLSMDYFAKWSPRLTKTRTT